MAVIAKMSINAARVFGNGTLLNLGCVCENGLMAHYSPENEDAVFTKYSPAGECGVTVPNTVELSGTGSKYYVLFRPYDDGEFEQAAFGVIGVVSQVIDWGQSKQVVMTGNDGMSLKMTIDNPNASVQFVPQTRYHIAFYDAEKLTMDDALKAARA